VTNFLNNTETGVANQMAETTDLQSQRRQREAATAARVAAYGPLAIDPAATGQALNNQLATDTMADKEQQVTDATTKADLDVDQAGRADQAWQAQQVVKAAAASDDPAGFIASLDPTTLTALGVDPSHVAPLIDKIKADPTALTQLNAALAPAAKSSKLVGNGDAVFVKGPDGATHALYPTLDGNGKITYQSPTLPDGYTITAPGEGAVTQVKNADGSYSLVQRDKAGGISSTALPQGAVPVTADLGQQRIVIAQQNADTSAARERVYAAKVKSDAAGGAPADEATVEYLAQTLRTKGTLPAMGMGSAALRTRVFAKAAADAAAEGDTGQSDVYTQQATKERGTAVNDLGRSTPTSAGGQISTINTFVNHADQYRALLGALGSGNIQVINQAQQAFKAATGSAAPTNATAVRAALGDEFAKLVAGGVVSQASQQQFQKSLQQYGSPQQFLGAVDQLQSLAAGRAQGLRQRYTAIDAAAPFDAALTPRARALIGVASPGGVVGGPANAGAPGGRVLSSSDAALLSKYGVK
jgi:hypothetical protein